MNATTNTWTTPPTVAAQIAGLPDLAMPAIKSLWLSLFDADPPTHNRQFLERRIAYRLQEQAFRQVNPQLLDRNSRRIASLLATGKVKKRDRDFRPTAGTLLTREYRGVAYRVAVTADGQYEFEGRMFPSLSMIAREITGTRWSGPVFFGIKPISTPKQKAKKGGQR